MLFFVSTLHPEYCIFRKLFCDFRTVEHFMKLMQSWGLHIYEFGRNISQILWNNCVFFWFTKSICDGGLHKEYLVLGPKEHLDLEKRGRKSKQNLSY